MSLVKVDSREELEERLKVNEGRGLIGFFGRFSPISQKAEPEFRKFGEMADVLMVDVGEVRNAHSAYGVNTVPTVISVIDGKVVNSMIGVQTAERYARAFLMSHSPGPNRDGRPAFPSVTVWTGDSCVWCSRVKAYLRKRGVPFREVNVSRDPSGADALRALTGQTGVPQLSIGGRYVVGFDKAKIDSYLGIDERQD